MSWADIWKIILAALASVGGVGGLIILVIKFSTNLIAERLSQKYQLSLQKELEKYKAGVENKTYISKARFNREFSMYQDLCEKNITMVYDMGTAVMITRGAKYPGVSSTQEFIHLAAQHIDNADMFSDGHETKVKDNPLNENFAKKEFQALWREINHKYAYTVDFDSAELIRNAIAHIDKKLFVSELQYTTTIGRQKAEMNEYEIERGDSFTGEKTRTQTLKHAEASQIKYDLIGKIAEGTVLTRRTVSAILQGIRVDKLYMFRNNPEEFISKVIRLINEQKATMIVEHISYDTIEGEYDSSIFTAEKATQSFDKAFLAKKAIQDYVFTDGSADKSIERKFAEDLDAAEEVCVYAKLPRTFQIPTPVGNYSPDWAIAFYEGTVKHIFFIAETKGTMESLELRPIEQAKISCAKKLFNEMSTSNVVYHDVDSYRSLLSIMSSI